MLNLNFLKTFCTKLVKQICLPLVVGNQMCALQENNIVARANCGSFRDQLIISTIKNGVTFVFMWFISATSFWSWSLLSKSKASVSSIHFLSTFCIHQSHCITCFFFTLNKTRFARDSRYTLCFFAKKIYQPILGKVK